jgi:hypothetical protein
MTVNQDPRALRSTKVAITDTSVESLAHDKPEDSYTLSVNPLLLQTLVDGISLPSNSAVLQHWLDFVLIAVLQFHSTLQTLVSPLGDCICKNLRARLDDIRKALREDHDHHDFRSNTTDAEFIMLLNALERLVLLSLPTADTGHAEDDDVPAEKPPGAEPGGFLGIVTRVFSSEAVPSNLEEHLTVRYHQSSCWLGNHCYQVRSLGYRSLDEAVVVLYAVWATTAQPKLRTSSPKHEMLSLICAKTRTRCLRVFEHFFRLQSAEVLESIVDCWNMERPVGLNGTVTRHDTHYLYRQRRRRLSRHLNSLIHLQPVPTTLFT